MPSNAPSRYDYLLIGSEHELAVGDVSNQREYDAFYQRKVWNFLVTSSSCESFNGGNRLFSCMRANFQTAVNACDDHENISHHNY